MNFGKLIPSLFRFRVARERVTEAAIAWGSAKFGAEDRPVAIFTAHILIRAVGLPVARLHLDARLLEDLRIGDDLEDREISLALEEEGVRMSVEEVRAAHSVGGLLTKIAGAADREFFVRWLQSSSDGGKA